MIHFPTRMNRFGGGLAALVLVVTMSPAATAAPEVRAADSLTLGEHLELLASVGKNYLARLRPEVIARLSSGGQKLIALAQNEPAIAQLAAAAEQPQLLTLNPSGPRAARPGFANDVFATEDLLSRLSGMTQSETSASWCDRNALIGFNDSGSFIATSFLALSPSGSLSFNGWSQSTDAGRSYTDRGALIADPIPAGLEARDLLGDPVLGCTSQRTFHYTSLAMDIGPEGSFINSGISVSTSTDGGTTFGPAVMASAKDGDTHFLDKPWFAVEPGPTGAASDDVLHVTYTDFDFTGAAPCTDQLRTAIEYVRSTDGGQTWTAPVVLAEACELVDGAVQGSQVNVGPGDDVYAGWEQYPFDLASQPQLLVRRSTDLGTSFGPAVLAAELTPVGDGFVFQGNFRSGPDLQGLVVDQTGGSRRGTVYLTFQDGSARQKFDPLGLCLGDALYCFGDVHIVSSTDGGATWSEPVRINNDDIRLGIDQWQPAVEVDRSGAVWVAYHDRRNDERNFLIDTFVARSTDGGASWRNQRATEESFPPVVGQDVIVNPVYMGDYITVTADRTGRHPGVITAWGDNALGDANIVERQFGR
jgi:hypothetical protein